MTQETLQFRKKPSASDVNDLIRLLELCGWQTRAEIADHLRWDNRHIRAVAVAAGAKVVCGPKGFNLSSKVEPSFLRRCAARFRAQASKMIERAEGWEEQAREAV